MSGWREVLKPRPRELGDYLEANAVVGGLFQLLFAVLVGAIATSRADGNQLTPWTLAFLVAAVAAAGVCVGWPAGLYGGASDTLRGLVVVPGDDSRAKGAEAGARWRAPVDEFDVRRLWRSVAVWAAAAGAWALAGGVLVVVVLDGRRAGPLVTIVALAALAGVAGRAVDMAARRRGVEMARSRPQGTVVAARRRAWLHVALPCAVVQGLVNAGVAWLFFHDYVIGDRYAPRALLEGPVIAEVGTIVALLVLVFAPMVRSWGEVDAALGRVDLPEAARTNTPVGPQAFVYLVIAGVLLGPAVGLLLPPTPSLVRVIVVRGGIAFALVALVTGLAHVRGAVNREAIA